MRIRLDPLDILFSRYVRLRAIKRVGGCERCLSQKASRYSLQCSHFHGRARKSVRWDEDNAAGLCAGCHMYLASHPLEHYEWFKQHLGEDKFNMLNSRMREMGKVDKSIIEIYLLERINNLEVKDGLEE